jgi:hypothetical protein
MADLDIQPVIDAQPVEEEKPFDLSKIQLSPYDKYRLAIANGATPENYSELPQFAGQPWSPQNPDKDSVREAGYAGPILTVAGQLADAAGHGLVKIADIPTKLHNKKIGAEDFNNPWHKETLEEREAMAKNGIVIPLPRIDTSDLKGAPAAIAGIENAGLSTIESMIGKPSSAFTLPLLAGEGSLAKVAAGVYGLNAAAQLPKEVQNAVEVYNDPKASTAEKTEAIANPVVQSALSYAMLKHATTGAPEAPVQGPYSLGRMLNTPKGAEPTLRVDEVQPLDIQSGSPLSPQELIARQSRAPVSPETPAPEIKTWNLDQPEETANAPQERQQPANNQQQHSGDGGERTPAEASGSSGIEPSAPQPAQANEPIPRAGDARGTPDQEAPQITLDSASKLSPEEFFNTSEGWARSAMADATKKTPGVQRLAEMTAEQNPDLAAWQKASDAANADAKRIRDEVLKDPTKMMERQKELMGAGQKAQFFSEGIKAIKKLQAEKPSGAPIGMGAAKYGEVNGPKTPLGELEQQIHILSEQSPGPVKQRAAFDLGKRVAGIKDGITENLQGLKSAGSYLFQKLTGPPKFNDLKKAIGNRHLALTDSAINAREFVRNAMKKIPDKLAQEAISNFVDAGGDDAVLRKALAETKPQYRAGYERALNLTQDEKTLAANIKQYFDSRLDDAVKNGILEDGIEDYIHRYYQSNTPWKNGVLAELRSGIFTGKPALAKQRVFDYDFEAEKAGLKPVKSFISRVAAYDLSLNKAIADRNIVKEMSQIKMPDGRPMVDVAGAGIPTGQPVEGQGATLIKPSAKPNSDKPIDNRSDYRPFDYPALRKWKWAGLDENKNPIMLQGDVLVHPDAVKNVKALFERSKIRENPIGRAALGVSSTVKQTMFDLSGFHPTQITVHGFEHRSSVPLNEYTAKFLGREFRPLTDYINDPDVRGMVRGGMVLGETTGRELFHEGLAGSSLTKHIPVLGPKLAQYTDWLFNDYIPRLKAETGLHAFERNQKRFPQLSKDQLYHLTAEQMNAAFGEQNYAMLGRSATMQDALRLAFVAPDFLESRAKFVGQAGTKFGREQFQALFLGAATMYITARLLNKAMDDEYHFEPKNAFSVIHNGKAYSLRTVQGDVLQAATDFEKFMRHRLNPVFGRTAMEAITQRDEFGRTRNAKEQLKDFATTIVPISFRGLLNPREQNLMESFLNAFGITERRSSPTTLVYDLANKYKSDHKIAQQPGEFIYDPDKDPYRAIRQAATFSSPQTVAEEIKRAVAEGKKVEDLQNHFSRYASSPFVGSKKNESGFFKSLDTDNQKIYHDAKLEKQKVLNNFETGLAIWRRSGANP